MSQPTRRPQPAARPIAGPKPPGVLEPGTTAKRSARPATLKVRATQVGYYEDCRRRVGDVFLCTDEAFSERWMEKVGAATPERTTDAGTALKQAHDEIIGGPSRRVAEDDDDVFGDDDAPKR